MISIVINNYNYGRFLREAIDSALNQTHSDTEVIVVDDGSTDDSREIIAAYGDRIIPVLKTNGGQGSTFNAGFAASHGELIFLLDSDDFFYPEKVATVQKIRSSEFAGKQVLLYHLLDVVDQSGRSQGTTLPPEFRPLQINWLDYARKFAHVPFVASPTSGLAISKGLAQQIFPIPEVRTSADDFVVGAAALLGDVHGIPEALAAFRMHGANRWFFSQLQLKPREFMHEYERYLNAKLVEKHLDPVIDYFGSPLSIRYAEGNASRLSRLGWTAVKRRHSPGMILFFLKTELKALKCLLKDCVARVHRVVFGFVQNRPRKSAVGTRCAPETALKKTETASATPRRQSTRRPLVSIIVNNYNYERFVGEAIDSALTQTYRPLEIIVVDDGSTDDSRKVIESRGDKIRSIFKTNGGQGSTFNAGFKASTGDLILFLDADDLLDPSAINTVVREWRDGLARIFFPLSVIDEKGAPRGRLVGGAKLPSPILGPFGIGSPTSGNVFSRMALEKIMPIPEVHWRISADLYLNATSLFGEFKCVAQPLGKYRVHGSNNIACAEPLAEIRSRIHLDLRLYEDLARLTGGKIDSLENWLGKCPRHWIRRMKSLRESPNDHPWADTLLGLTGRAIKASWREPDQTFHRRLAYTIFVMAYGLSPRKTSPVLRKALRKMDGSEHGRTIRLLLGA